MSFTLPPMPYTTLISVDALHDHLSSSDWVMVDCRFSLKDTEKGRRAYLESHLPGAVYAHLDEDLSGQIIPGKTGRHPLPDVETFATWLGKQGISNTTQVVAYDDMGGPIAARLWWMMRWLGHEKVAVLDGGWHQWGQKGYTVTTDLPTPSPHTFIPSPDTSLIATLEDVQKHATSSSVLIDARAYERYAGIKEPIDPVAGHIPGAYSFPFKENLDNAGLFKSAAALQERFAAIAREKNIVCYCGSGVTAAHNILAMTYAGLQHVALYPGSWSEWIVDPERAVERI